MSALRQVHRLRLRAPDATLVGRARLLLEDALRTASLPGNGGRVVLIRTLDVGRFAPDISPAALARLIERRVAELGRDIIYAGAPDADTAPAVWFHDRLDAHLSLARRVAENSRVDAWFWPRAVPGWRSSTTVPEQLRAITLSLAKLPEAPTALLAFVRDIARLGHADRLAASLTQADIDLLTRGSDGKPAVAAIDANDGARRPGADTALSDDAVTAAPPVARHPRPAATDEQTLAVDVSSPAVRSTNKIGGDDNELEPIEKPTVERALAETPTTVSGRALLPAARRAAALASLMAQRQLPPASIARDVDSVTAPGSSPFGQRAEGEVETAPRFLDSTAAGGLLMLLPVMIRLGLPQWLEDAPDWARHQIVPRLLTYICTCLRLPADDPAWLLGTPSGAAPPPTSFCAPVVWAQGIADARSSWRLDSTANHRLWDASGRLLMAAWPAQSGSETHEAEALSLAVARAWITACRRWLRRYARIGLADLVLRPAHLSLTPTHADVHFELSNVSLAVRRAGLDLDPGWLPWFGRIVSFHYERGS